MGFVADEDLRFTHLSPELRVELRAVEHRMRVQLRAVMAASVVGLPAAMQVAIRPAIAKIEEGVPAEIIRAQYEIFKKIDELMREYLIRESAASAAN